MSIPIMIMNVMQSMFNIIDMTVMKMAGKATAVGAIGACGSLITLCTCLLIGVSTGANVVVARRIGAKDKDAADRAVTTLIFMCAIRFVWVYLVYPFLPPNLTFLYLIWPIGWVLSSVTLYISCRIGMSKMQKKSLSMQS